MDVDTGLNSLVDLDTIQSCCAKIEDMRPSVISTSQAPLLNAIEQNLHEHIAFVQRSTPGMTVLDEGDLLVVDSGLSSNTFNKIARARLQESEVDRRAKEALAYFTGVERPFAWWVGPGSRPLDLENRLREHGLEATEYELGMAMELSELPPNRDCPRDLTARCVTCLEELTDFASVFAANWQPPDPAVLVFYKSAAPVLLEDRCPMKLFVGYLDDEPVASSELFLSGRIAGLYSVCTRRDCRGRGISSALTLVALDYARCRGIPTAVLQSSDDGKGLYTRLGFSAYCDFAEFTTE
jgi:ribosomal protein S18 acetylase RimI-like enzyme